jgi:N-acetylglucosaminyl-diphospho-decaprenol L-rhamnosyltransferase
MGSVAMAGHRVAERAAYDQIPGERPEARVRHGHVQRGARRRDPTQHDEEAVRVRQVLEHVIAEDRVERRLELVENGRGVANGDLVVGPSGDGRRTGNDFDAADPLGAGGAEPAAGAALATSHVQHPAKGARQSRYQVSPRLRVVAGRLHRAEARLPRPSVKDLAVVIVNYRTPDDVSASIASVERTGGAVVAEIVVVDNASGDGSAALLRERHPGSLVIEEPRNRGFAAGVNVGFRATTAPYVLALNPDTEVRPGALSALRNHLHKHPEVGVAGPVLLDLDGSVRLDSYKGLPSLWSIFCGAFFPLGRVLMGTRFHPELRARRDSARGGPVARVCGSTMAIRRAAFDEVGPLDESYFLYFEDVEWQRRAAAQGWGIEVVADARVVHAIQGAHVRETWPLPYVDSAFRYLVGLGHAPRRIAAVLLTGFALSRMALRAAAAVPALRDKAKRMDAGYAKLATRVRELRDAHCRAVRTNPAPVPDADRENP